MPGLLLGIKGLPSPLITRVRICLVNFNFLKMNPSPFKVRDNQGVYALWLPFANVILGFVSSKHCSFRIELFSS
jgi:hypothetical protein